MPRDYADHPKLKGLTGKHRKTAVEHLEQMDAKLAYEAVAAELEEAHQIRQELPAIKGELAALRKRLDQPQKLEATLKQPYKPKGTVKRLSATDSLGTALVAEFLRFVDQKDVDATLQDFYPGDEGRIARKLVRAQLVKSASNPATGTDIGWAADLTTSDVVSWVSAIKAVSVYGAMFAAGGRPIPMGDNESVIYPMRSEAGMGSMAQSFVAPGASIPVKEGSFSAQSFSRKKAAIITVASKELAKVSAFDLRQILLEMVMEDSGKMLDSVLLDPTLNAVAGIRPASPWFGAANQASGGTDLQSIISDLSWLISSIDRPAKPLLIMDPSRELRLRSWRDSMGWVFAPEMDSKGTILGVPFVSSINCPTAQVYIADCADFLSWLPNPEVAMSEHATVVMADDSAPAPQMLDENAVNDFGGSIHVSDAAGAGAVTRSMLQTYSVALRVIQPVEFGMLRANRTAYLSGVSW